MRVLKVGITGGIGSGKSTVAKMIQLLGFPVYNADVRAKELMTDDPNLVAQVSALFGAEVYQNGQLERAKIASRVFVDSSLLQKLEGLVHPAVYEDFESWAKAQTTQLIFKEAAILLESGGADHVDYVIAVTAPEEERVNRVMRRDGLSLDQVKSRMQNQWSEEKKIELSDYTIYADDAHMVIHQVRKVVQHLLERLKQ